MCKYSSPFKTSLNKADIEEIPNVYQTISYLRMIDIAVSSRLPAFIRSSAEPPPKYSMMIQSLVPLRYDPKYLVT